MEQSAIMGVNFPPMAGLLPDARLRWQEFFEGAFAHVEEQRAESVAVFWKELRECLQGGAGA